jgi:hypothetical protein
VSRALQEAADEAVSAARAGAEGLTRLVEAVVPRAELEASKIECSRLLEEAEIKILTAEAEIKRLHSQLEKTVPVERLVAAHDECAALWLANNF